MSKKSELLIDDNQLLILQTKLAVLVGDRQAIALQQVHYWADLNEKANKHSTHFHDGRWWVYNTWSKWRSDNFPFWTVSTIRRVFKSLEKEGLITTRPHEDRNSGLWVCVNYDNLNALLAHEVESPREQRLASRAANRSAQIEQTPKMRRKSNRSAQIEQTGLLKLNRPSAQIEQPTGNTEITEISQILIAPADADANALVSQPVPESTSDQTSGASTSNSSTLRSGSSDKPARAAKPRNVWYDTIFAVWGYTAGRNKDMEKMLRGLATKRGHKEYNLEQPLTDPAEIHAWLDWYVHVKRKGFSDNRPLEVLAKVQSSFGEWRAWQAAQAAAQGEADEIERQRAARRAYEAAEQARIAALAGVAA